MRPDLGRLRRVGTVVVLAAVFVVVNAQVVHAADGSGESGDLLAPLNIPSSEGVPIDGYELTAAGEGILDFRGEALGFALSGLFMLIRLLVGLAGWAIEVTFRFPLLKVLAAPAQKAADAYNTIVVDSLGLKGVLLAWSFVFTGFMIVRGRMARGLGEMALTLVIAAFAASALIRPDTLLAADGPLGQSQEVAAAVAQESVNSYDWGGKLASRSPCDNMAGRQELKCLEREGEGPVSATEVARPLQDSITNALIVKPYMLLQYGRILDPATPADRAAYHIHLRWITGGYKAGSSDGGAAEDGKDDPCDKIWGEAKKYCQADRADGPPDVAPAPTNGLPLDGLNATVTEGHAEFVAFLADLKKAGEVGEACAAYAEEPTWWRVGGVLLLLVAAVFIAGMLLSAALVLLGTQAACAAAAAVSGVTFVAAMLPGPARQSVWKWLSLWGIACLTVVGMCAFIPFFAIAVDATVTEGPDLMIERMLLLVALAALGAALHRRLLAGISGFGRRMALRMRYAKVGGTHLPGDTSELGAALGMHSPALRGGGHGGGGLRGLSGGGGRFGLLGTRRRLMGALASATDGTGMAVDTGGLLADARAEASRGLAPLTAAGALAGLGARLGGKGTHWLLIGRRPGPEQLARWQHPTAQGDDPENPAGPVGPGGSAGVPGRGPGEGPGRGPDGGRGAGGRPGRRPRGGVAGPWQPQGRVPSDRYRDEDGRIVDRSTGQVLHDQNIHRTLLATRAHNRLVRLRGYRILNRTTHAAYATTLGLPSTTRRTHAAGTRFAADARRQVRVWGNTAREDARTWGDAGRRAADTARAGGDRSGPAPFTSRRLPQPAAPTSTPATRGAGTGASLPVPLTREAPPAPAAGGASPSSIRTRPSASRAPDAGRTDSALPGGRAARDDTRRQAREQFQELLRRTRPDTGQPPSGGQPRPDTDTGGEGDET
ncbi:hypothetical protein [Streptomyces sp. NPDC093094]|uniref:hypothetical protein n=1 Tax=Streptomyces sp. NPDC093094 TaxID=3366026 RepID=UPI00382281E8